jgi:glutaredoxin
MANGCHIRLLNQLLAHTHPIGLPQGYKAQQTRHKLHIFSLLITFKNQHIISEEPVYHRGIFRSIMNLFNRKQIPASSKNSIIVYGAHWCSDCRRSIKYLKDNQIPYKFIDVDLDKNAANLVKQINRGMRSIPTIIFPDGSILVEPSNNDLAEKILSQNSTQV